jgi:hypothetical protein
MIAQIRGAETNKLSSSQLWASTEPLMTILKSNEASREVWSPLLAYFGELLETVMHHSRHTGFHLLHSESLWFRDYVWGGEDALVSRR